MRSGRVELDSGLGEEGREEEGEGVGERVEVERVGEGVRGPRKADPSRMEASKLSITGRR